MTGSPATPFIIPIILAGLAIWLVLVFMADARPRRAARESAHEARTSDVTESPAVSSGGPDDSDRGKDQLAPVADQRAA